MDGPQSQHQLSTLNKNRLATNSALHPYTPADINPDDIPTADGCYTPSDRCDMIILRKDWQLESEATAKFDIPQGCPDRPSFEATPGELLVYTNGVWRMQVGVIDSGTNEPLDPNLLASRHWVTLTSRTYDDGFDLLEPVEPAC